MRAQKFHDSLARLEQDPTRLERWRELRFGSNSPRPAYASSGTTTAPPSLGPREPSPVDMRSLTWREWHASLPSTQFKKQARRLYLRVIRQKEFGRKQTYPGPDIGDTFHAHADNLVRERWLTQNIWQPSWGPAWPPESDGMSGIGPSKVGPDWTYSGRGSSEKPGIPADPSSNSSMPLVKRESGKRKTKCDAAQDDAKLASYRASRPLQQFLAQLSEERQWIKDEAEYTHEGPSLDLDTAAFQSLRQFWVEQGIWRPHWKVVPGDEWLHESMDLETYRQQRDQVVETPRAEEDKPRSGADERIHFRLSNGETEGQGPPATFEEEMPDAHGPADPLAYPIYRSIDLLDDIFFRRSPSLDNLPNVPDFRPAVEPIVPHIEFQPDANIPIFSLTAIQTKVPLLPIHQKPAGANRPTFGRAAVETEVPRSPNLQPPADAHRTMFGSAKHGRAPSTDILLIDGESETPAAPSAATQQETIDVSAPAKTRPRRGRPKKQPVEDEEADTANTVLVSAVQTPRRSNRLRNKTSPDQVKGNNHSRPTPAKRTRNNKKAQRATPASASKPKGVSKTPAARGRPKGRKAAAKK